jgi:hypothetical protein
MLPNQTRPDIFLAASRQPAIRKPLVGHTSSVRRHKMVMLATNGDARKTVIDRSPGDKKRQLTVGRGLPQTPATAAQAPLVTGYLLRFATTPTLRTRVTVQDEV